MHQKTEGAYIRALAEGKGDLHYVALVSLTGPSRTLFFSGFPSFAAWETAKKQLRGNPSLAAALGRANAADGDLLSATDASLWTRRDDLSVSDNIVGARLMVIYQFIVRPGHTAQMEEYAKTIKEAYEKAMPETHYTVFQQAFGATGSTFLVTMPTKSAADIDARMASKAVRDSIGEDGMKKMDGLEQESVESTMVNVFLIDPSMSYVPDSWMKADPGFWKMPKMGAPGKKAEAKPAQ